MEQGAAVRCHKAEESSLPPKPPAADVPIFDQRLVLQVAALGGLMFACAVGCCHLLWQGGLSA
jgi:hypothetical protein